MPPNDPVTEYDRTLVRWLGAMPAAHQAAFAIACAERQFPGLALANDPGAASLVRHALDLAWTALTEPLDDATSAASLAQQCETLLYERHESSPFPPYAEDAIAAAVFALEAAAAIDAEAPAWAARRGIDSLDAYVQATTSGPGGTETERLWAHPYLRTELARRAADMETLQSLPLPEAIREIRQRTSSASLTPLESLASVNWSR